ncbi:hypothetical protein AWC38_SpisGene14900 [Stylophora pistillata]|uniref:Uncharacterized protein n=1 Tax=Stylophora pistillata TaxID=50429 RepID=A0A2B4RWC1_STYPI|nr:hypothetical protein AWC38_SpisGene14900 [Stylophora pistillata]
MSASFSYSGTKKCIISTQVPWILFIWSRRESVSSSLLKRGFEIDDEEGWMNIISSRLFPRASGQCQAENDVITKSRNSRDERKSRQLPETLTGA